MTAPTFSAALLPNQDPSVATPRYDNLATFDTNARQNCYALDYAFNNPIVPNYLVDQSFYSGAQELNSFVPFDGDIAPNHIPTLHNLSSLTANYVSNVGPWTSLNPDSSNPAPSISSLAAAYVSNVSAGPSLSPDFSNPAPSVSRPPAAYASGDGPGPSSSPDFSNRRAPQATVDHSFWPIPNSYNSTTSPHAATSHTAYLSGDMERVAETSQPVLTNLAAPSASTGRQRVMKPRSVCKTCRKSFSRPSDLDRHAKKHQAGAKVHTCSVPGCDYEGSYRKDKLTAHMKNCHK